MDGEIAVKTVPMGRADELLAGHWVQTAEVAAWPLHGSSHGNHPSPAATILHGQKLGGG